MRSGSIGSSEDDMDELHVCIEGGGDDVAAAVQYLELIMSSPEEAQKLKQEQLGTLAIMSGSGAGSAGGAGGHYGPGAAGGGGGHYGPGAGGGAMGAGARPGLGFGGDEQTETIEVPNLMVGSLIGRGGENIQTIQRNSGCHVQV